MNFIQRSMSMRWMISALLLTLLHPNCATREGRMTTAPLAGAIAGTAVGIGVGALTGDINAGANVGYAVGALGGISYSGTMADRMPANPSYVYKVAPKELSDAGKAYHRLHSQLPILEQEKAVAKTNKNNYGSVMAGAKANQSKNETEMWIKRMYQVEWVMNQSVEGKMMGSSSVWKTDNERRDMARLYIKAFRDLKSRYGKLAK